MKFFGKHLSLQRKFFLSLTLATAVLCVFFSAIFYVHMTSVVEEQVREKAELTLAQVDAVQAYVRSTLRPRMFERHPTEFIIEAMSSSYISRKIMDNVGEEALGLLYRRVSIGARNSEFEANDIERMLIDRFRTDTSLDKWAGTLRIRNVDYFAIGRPVRFAQSCMQCHGLEDDAPVELVELYGNNGFGHDLDSIDGLDFIAFPAGATEAQLQGVIVSYFILFALCALFFFTSAFLAFRILVVRRLYGLATSFRGTLSEDEQTKLFKQLKEKDEVEEVVECFEQVASHLADARLQLQSYADNLKGMVEARTSELSYEARERQADVALFVHLFEDMRGTRTSQQLWNTVLPRICRRFGAQSIMYVCTFGLRRHYVWPEGVQIPSLPEPLTPLIVASRVQVQGKNIFIPVEAQDGATEGLLCLTWDNETEAERQNIAVLGALGRQLGTVAENIMALDRIMRQMDLLQAVFDGVGDPLVLFDDTGTLIVANESARRLARELYLEKDEQDRKAASQSMATHASPVGTAHASQYETLTGADNAAGNLISLLLGHETMPLCESVLQGQATSRTVLHNQGRSFLVHLYPIPEAENRPGRLAAYVRETTAERQMLARINQSERLASVGKLSAGLAHEINNPLGVILCYAELLRQGATNDQIEDLDIIVRHTRQAQRVLRDLLNFARPKSYIGIPLDAETTVRRVLDVFAPQARKKDLTITFEVQGPILPVAIGEQALEQAMTNLILNALDAAPEKGGCIVVNMKNIDADAASLLYTQASRTTRGGRMASPHSGMYLTVADNGCGLDAEACQRVFDPFYTTKDRGTGLGLAVVYGAITDAGGIIEVESPSGLCVRGEGDGVDDGIPCGTSFAIFVPHAKEATMMTDFSANEVSHGD